MRLGYSFDWVDAFANRPFAGNGCAVVHDAAALPPETCLAFTRETGLVECTFLEPSQVADIKIRYFLTSHEIPFAGHPTIASLASLLERDAIAEGPVRIETGAGVLDCEVRMRADGLPEVCLRQIAPEFGAQVPAAVVAGIYGLSPEQVIGTPQMVSTGLPFCVTILRDHDALRQAVLNSDALEVFRENYADGSPFAEPFLTTLNGATHAGQSFSRLLLPPPNPPEDPFTGSASGAMACYLWRYEYLSSPEFIAEQGHDMGRPGQAMMRVIGPPDAIDGVEITGTSYIVMRGTLRL